MFIETETTPNPATLKQGIESLIRHYVPEVSEVRAA